MIKVMVVDDEPDLRDMIEMVMKKEGYETRAAVDGNDFLANVEEFHPDIVTLDVMMPGPNTWEILSRVKELSWQPKIILLTVVRYSEEEKNRIREMGNVIAYVTKPFEIDVLCETVKHAVEESMEAF